MKNKITKRGKMNAYKVEIKIVNKKNKKLEATPAIERKIEDADRETLQKCENLLYFSEDSIQSFIIYFFA